MKEVVKQISDTFFEVLGYSVKIQTRKGRRLLLCSCSNHQRFCTENAYCSHKEMVLAYLAIKPIKSKIEGPKSEIEGFKNNSLPISKEMYEDYLDKIFRLFKLN